MNSKNLDMNDWNTVITMVMGGGNFDPGISFENYLICISQTNARTKSKEIH